LARISFSYSIDSLIFDGFAAVWAEAE